MSTEKFHHKVGTKEIVLPRFDNIPLASFASRANSPKRTSSSS